MNEELTTQPGPWETLAVIVILLLMSLTQLQAAPASTPGSPSTAQIGIVEDPQ